MRSLRVVALCFFVGLTAHASAATRYVNVALSTGADNGTTWQDAYRTADGVGRALAASATGDEIWVSRGTYRPTTTTTRSIAISLRSGIALYGGFAGTETLRDARDVLANATILSGDLAGNDPVLTDNSSHVVSGNSANATAILDGFTITAGNASGAAGGAGDLDKGGGMLFLSGSNATVRNCRIIGNRSTFGGGGTYIRLSSPAFVDCVWQNNQGGFFGGAIDMFNTCSPAFTRCVFRSNSAARAGGVEAFGACLPAFTNCVFSGNTAGSSGGGALFVSDQSTATLRHCTIARNTASVASVGVLTNPATGATTRLFNTIVFDNITTGGALAVQLSGTTTQTSYCCVQGGFVGTGTISTAPRFVDALAGDFRLAPGSPCIDASDNAQSGAGNTLDHSGNPRRIDDPATIDTGAGGAPFADMGAYEFVPVGVPCDSIDFNADGVFPDSGDIADFLSVFGGGPCSNDPLCNDIDFNNDGVFPDSGDIGSLLSVFGGGAC